MQVFVRDNNVDQALRVLKKKMRREGIFREMKARRAYEKPSEKKTREKAEAIRRARKAARKLAQREGLIPTPKKKVAELRSALRLLRKKMKPVSADGVGIRLRWHVLPTTQPNRRKPPGIIAEGSLGANPKGGDDEAR